MVFFLAACKGRENGPKPQAIRYEHGAYILCEGNYGWGEGSVYYLDTSNSNADAFDAYRAANGFRAGNVVQSLILSGDSAYLTVNNSNKVELLDAHTLKRLTANTTLTSPRYLLPVGTNLLVTDLYADRMSVLDRGTLATRKTISAPGWTECLIQRGGQVYVATRRPSARASGELNEHLLVLEASSLTLTDSIKLGGQGAQELVTLTDGRMVTALEKDFVLGGGPGLAYLYPSGRTVTHTAALPGKPQQPVRLQQMGGLLFWLQGDALCWMPESGGTVLYTLPFGMASNPTSLKIAQIQAGKARLWVADARDYTSPGILRELELDLTSGIFTTRHETRIGIIPGQIVLF